MRSSSFAALGTSAIVAVTDDAALPRARAMLEIALARLDAACSRFRPDSELSRANACAGRTVEISPLLANWSPSGCARMTRPGPSRSDARSDLRAAATTARSHSSRRARLGVDDPRPARFWRHDRARRSSSAASRACRRRARSRRDGESPRADRAGPRDRRADGRGALVSLGGDIAVAGDAAGDGWPSASPTDHARAARRRRARRRDHRRAASPRRARRCAAGGPTAARPTTCSTRAPALPARDTVADGLRGGTHVPRRERCAHRGDRPRRRRTGLARAARAARATRRDRRRDRQRRRMARRRGGRVTARCRATRRRSGT